MQTIDHEDGSKNYLYEPGDWVRLIKADTDSAGVEYGCVGDWGYVFRVDKPLSPVAFLDVQLAGYCRPADAFVQSCRVPSWFVEPYDPYDTSVNNGDGSIQSDNPIDSPEILAL
jgi:hypothetical protein